MATSVPPLPPVPRFPAGFRWGVSASAFQIEGSPTADGRGPSSWDAFTRERGRVKDGSHAEVATDHYRRYREDVALMGGLGVDAYRFSVSWSRVLPDGHGAVNRAGLDFYDRLVDELCAAGIDPVPTLFHWDTPLALEERGGWLERDTAERFAAYASVVAERLADRVPMWITINEPAEVTLLGYGLGEHAPGKQLVFDALPAAHHQLLAHGLGVQALRAAGARHIGIAASHSPVGRRRGRRGPGRRRVVRHPHQPPLRRPDPDRRLPGRPGIPAARPGGRGPQGDLGPAGLVRGQLLQPDARRRPHPGGASAFGGIEIPSGLPFAFREIEGYERTDFDWPVVPDGLRELLATLRERYGDRLPPLYITENGCSYGDGPDPGTGRIEDARRIAYHEGHVRALHEAMAEGADVRGYFIWSILDNFEWAEGYRQRFGLVHVDYETLARTPKESYAWYRDLIKSGR